MNFWNKLFGSTKPPKPTIAKCDVCSREVSWSDGYVITPTQALTSRGYWEQFFMKPEIKDRDVSEEEAFGVVRMAVMSMMMSSGSTGWLVCEQCSSRFTFDREVAKQCAVAGRQPRGCGRPDMDDVTVAAIAGWAATGRRIQIRTN